MDRSVLALLRSTMEGRGPKMTGVSSLPKWGGARDCLHDERGTGTVHNTLKRRFEG